MRPFLVMNPGSRNRRGWRLAAEYAELLRARGVEFTSAETGSMEDAETLTRRALREGFRSVIAVGGDGTINRVIQGFFDEAGRPSEAKFGVLYAGTSPDFCRFHDIPTGPEAAVDLLLRGTARPIDVCRLGHRNETGEEQVSYFASSANIGVGAGIARRANRLRRYLGDFTGTLWAAIVTVLGHRPRSIEVTADEREILLDRVWNVTVGKNPHLAGGLRLDLPSDPSDGVLYCFAAHGMGRLHFLKELPGFYRGHGEQDGTFDLQSGLTKVTINPVGARVETECDGDPAGWCPAEIDVVPRAIRLIGGDR